jgi:hypothetical protein
MREILIEEVPKDHLPIPAFQVTCARLILQAEVFTAFSPDTTRKLIFAYNRLESTNDLHAQLREARTGLFSLVGHLAARFLHAGGDQVLDQRKQLEEKLLDRCREIEPHLEAALRAVNAELAALP